MNTPDVRNANKKFQSPQKWDIMIAGSFSPKAAYHLNVSELYQEIC
jgi:hypothetical protein